MTLKEQIEKGLEELNKNREKITDPEKMKDWIVVESLVTKSFPEKMRVRRTVHNQRELFCVESFNPRIHNQKGVWITQKTHSLQTEAVQDMVTWYS